LEIEDDKSVGRERGKGKSPKHEVEREVGEEERSGEEEKVMRTKEQTRSSSASRRERGEE